MNMNSRVERDMVTSYKSAHETSVNQTVTSSSMSHYTTSKEIQPSKWANHLIQSCFVAYHVKIAVKDIVLEEHMKDIKKETIQIQLRLGQKTLAEHKLVKGKDVLTKVPLSTQISEDKITLIATAPGLDENIGSVSIPQYIILNGGLNTYEQWITLFEHEEDDEYDGEMGLNDDEEPRIQLRFEIAQDVVQKKKVYTSTKTVTEKE